MHLPGSYYFSEIDQMLLSSGTATRLLTACGLGGVVGLEREWRHKASGLRTNMLICMGCAFFTLLSAVLAGHDNPDKGRVAANIVQGIGFLGAGADSAHAQPGVGADQRCDSICGGVYRNGLWSGGFTLRHVSRL